MSETQCFVNGLPWVLPIFLGDLAQTDKLNGPDEIPTRLKISDATYQLGGITFWNRVRNTLGDYNNVAGSMNMMVYVAFLSRKYLIFQLLHR